MNPRYPVFIVSKGRAASRLTSRALDAMGVPHRVIVEKQELPEYGETYGRERVLALPEQYLNSYDTCDNLGRRKSVGPGAARNYAWDLASRAGHKRHWVMDDNIDAFHRMNRNVKAEVDSGTILAVAEDFVDRYTNIAIAGFNYYSMCKSTDAVPPFVLNTRIYSCLLMQTYLPFRWRARYNEDTDLSLRVLKAGWVTLQFNAFLCGKETTQRMSGGNTKEFYENEGTRNKSQMLADLHPDVARVTWRFNRWHHHVDYKPFKGNKLIRHTNVRVRRGVNNYGMKFYKQKETHEERD